MGGVGESCVSMRVGSESAHVFAKRFGTYAGPDFWKLGPKHVPPNLFSSVFEGLEGFSVILEYIFLPFLDALGVSVGCFGVSFFCQNRQKWYRGGML